MREVAVPVPTTAGSPNSRATMAAWLIEPPMSDTAPAIFWKIGAQVGLVIWQTRTSPSRTRAISSTDFTTHAGPSTTPLEAVRIAAGAQPGVEALARDAPEHDDRRIVDHVGNRTERGRGAVPGPLRDRRPPLA